MNRRQILASLNKIANELDNTGLHREATSLTNVMRKIAQNNEGLDMGMYSESPNLSDPEFDKKSFLRRIRPHLALNLVNEMVSLLKQTERESGKTVANLRTWKMAMDMIHNNQNPGSFEVDDVTKSILTQIRNMVDEFLKSEINMNEFISEESPISGFGDDEPNPGRPKIKENPNYSKMKSAYMDVLIDHMMKQSDKFMGDLDFYAKTQGQSLDPMRQRQQNLQTTRYERK
jgi:hypothetical protein